MAKCELTLFVKIERTKYTVTFVPGESAAEIIKALRDVPLGATVDEAHTNELGVTTLVFHHEMRSPVPVFKA